MGKIGDIEFMRDRLGDLYDRVCKAESGSIKQAYYLGRRDECGLLLETLCQEGSQAPANTTCEASKFVAPAN